VLSSPRSKVHERFCWVKVDRHRFAPTKYRARMLASVFLCQPLGQLIAVLMAFAATTGFKSYIASAPGAAACTAASRDIAGMECAKMVDRSWRLVAGLGAVPAAIAIIFRLTIPESVSDHLAMI